MVESGGGDDHKKHHHVRTVASAEDYPLERILDPCNDRKQNHVPKPPRYPMDNDNLWETNAQGTTINLAQLEGTHCGTLGSSSNKHTLR